MGSRPPFLILVWLVLGSGILIPRSQASTLDDPHVLLCASALLDAKSSELEDRILGYYGSLLRFFRESAGEDAFLGWLERARDPRNLFHLESRRAEHQRLIEIFKILGDSPETQSASLRRRISDHIEKLRRGVERVSAEAESAVKETKKISDGPIRSIQLPQGKWEGLSADGRDFYAVRESSSELRLFKDSLDPGGPSQEYPIALEEDQYWISPDHKTLVYAAKNRGSSSLNFLELETGKVRPKIVKNLGKVEYVKWIDGRVLFGGEKNRVLWDPVSAKTMGRWKSFEPRDQRSIAIDPKGTRAIIQNTGDRGPILWDLTRDKPRGSIISRGKASYVQVDWKSERAVVRYELPPDSRGKAEIGIQVLTFGGQNGPLEFGTLQIQTTNKRQPEIQSLHVDWKKERVIAQYKDISNAREIRVFDLNSGREIIRIPLSSSSVAWYSADFRRVLFSGINPDSSVLSLFDLESGTRLLEFSKTTKVFATPNFDHVIGKSKARGLFRIDIEEALRQGVRSWDELR